MKRGLPETHEEWQEFAGVQWERAESLAFENAALRNTVQMLRAKLDLPDDEGDLSQVSGRETDD